MTPERRLLVAIATAGALVALSSGACTRDQFSCRDGSGCVDRERLCNNRPDCRDYSDEENCDSQPRPACTGDQFSCRDGSGCVDRERLCDDRPDCRDYSDEENCDNQPRPACTGDQFSCRDGSGCVDRERLCDDRPDCRDYSDEENCDIQPRPACTRDQFSCRDGSGCVDREHLCDGRPDCRDYSDEENCDNQPRPACTPDQFQCHDGSGCVDRERFCDNRPDCRDYSDEENCYNSTSPDVHVCPLGQFLCTVSRICIPLDKRCDGNIDCLSENSDEIGCPCNQNQFECDDKTCIDSRLRCNGEIDCPRDGSDEQDCSSVPALRDCTSAEFSCRNGYCIPLARHCDGSADCPDNSDEQCYGDCTSEQFKCGNGYCISKELRCDGLRQCNDGTDEQGCSIRCREDQFKCLNGRVSCIDRDRRCNRVRDCDDASDEENCDKCRSDQYQCNDGVCLPASVLCNGFPDCRDGSDERNCPTTQCRPYEFQCRDRSCVLESKKCDGFPDCQDMSDEDGCEFEEVAPCPPSDFTCHDGSCIPKVKRCDGRQDCPDGFDEVDCSDGNTVECMANEFRCNDGSCIQAAYRCDNVTDCPDRSDELTCRLPTCNLASEFTCTSGECVKYDQRCDGTPDCRDGSDEHNCQQVRCRPDEFLCDGRRCVQNARRCDHVYDCADQTDENNCAYPQSCQANEFQCGEGSCIPIEKRCDGRSVDCRDSSDERGCPDSYAVHTEKPPLTCGPGQFACHSGDQCVPQLAHCNNQYDCRDYSDESNCAGNPEGLNLKTYPNDQIIKESREVVFQCRDEGPLRASVWWTRGNGLPLPPGSRVINGRLEMPNIQLEHSGAYICEAKGFAASTSGSRASVYLKVEPFEQIATPTRPECLFNQATCSDGECIFKSQVCDGHYDCADGSDELRCNPHGCEPNEFRCDNKKCVQKTWRCDSDDDCGDGSDEKNCEPSPPGSTCRYNEFKCARQDQCIPKAFHCDMEVDCLDGSDEFGCSKSEIQKPPPSMVVKQPGESFTITCTAVGVPTPEIVWRLNWGHIPSKCQTTSENGFGTMTCPNLQESDQGAYSCEALNNRGSTFAIPDTILVVQSPNTTCPPGTFNDLARHSGECISCFCFGASTSCRSADLFIYQLPPPLDVYKVVNVHVPRSGGIEIRRGESQFQTSIHPSGRSGFQISLTDNELKSSYYTPVYPYFALPENYHGNQLKSYGGYIKYTVKTDGTGVPNSIPDVILSGNGYVLVYKGVPLNPGVENNVAVQFYPGSWYRVSQDSRGGDYPASRQDIMMALQQVDQLLIRTQYFNDGLETTITDINMDSAAYRNVGQGQAAFVEHCDCPVGYSGLSCESCQPGFKHEQGRGLWLGTCETPPTPCPPKYYMDSRDSRCHPCPCPHTDSQQFCTSCYLDTDMNITAQCLPGYEGRRCEKCSYPLYIGNPLQGQPCVRREEPECNAAGSNSPQPDPRTGQCSCKEYVTGRLCDQCKPNSFNLATGNRYGCINCFCMGINTTCDSSHLYRTQVTAAFTRDNQDFKLSEANHIDNADRTITDIAVNPAAREIYFQQFNTGTYYWVLPDKFLFNKVTSYGGYLKYTLRYVPTPGGRSHNNAPDVEIVADNGVRLLYFSKQQPEPNRPVTVTVPLLEQYWARVDGMTANRDQLLMGLAELSKILIKATYTTTTQEAALISVSLDTATSDNTGQNRAVEVELCSCPAGYRGTSCEECDAGYTRIEEGLYLGTCEPCSCNGFSSECDPDTGTCMNCRGNTQGKNCELCVEGYEGNPGAGVPCTPQQPGCYCDPRGRVSPDCDQRQQCRCKTNVIGQSCSECRTGTFDLSESNLEGCIECYCSGVTSDCQSSNLYREAIPMQIIDTNHQFTLTDPTRQVVIGDGFLLNPGMNEIGYNFANNQRQQRLFWSLPPDFTGNKVVSYGGYLNFTKRYSAHPSSPPSFDMDVILFGSSLSLYWTDEENLQPEVTKTTSIQLKEANWRHLDPSVGQRPASRSELMRVLSSLQAVLVRATHSTHTTASYLSDVSLDTAVSQRTGGPTAAQVEVCRCPPGYRGTSCESCSIGHYQDYDGTCKKCPCHGNEEYCALGPQQQVTCTCKPSFGGTYCERPINGRNPRPPTDPPTISISITDPTVIVIEAGKDVTFRCTGRSLTTSTPVGLEWSKESGQLPPGRASDDRRGLLIIKDVQASDSGTYICTATDGITFVTEKAMLNVGGSPMSRPVVTVTPRSLDVREGEPVEFRCDATGVPTPTLTWRGERTNKMPPQSSFASGVFRIPYASLQDQGQYTCIAGNIAGNDSEIVSLYVRSAPPTSPPLPQVRLTISPHDYSGQAGDTVRLECIPSSPRNIRLQWSRHDGELSPYARDSDGIFTIYNPQPEDSGIYTCTAVEWPSGAIVQEVRARVNINAIHRPQPIINIEPSKQTAPQNSVVELRCTSSDGPVQWSKAGDSLPPNAKVDGNVLRIENVQVKDRGVYVCQVEGQGGLARVTSIVEVERREAPAIELFPKGSQTVIEGGSAIFQCRVTQGIPDPTVRWTRVDGTPLSRNVEQLPGGVLRFNSAARSDEGQYLCTADNAEGSASTVAILEVHSMPVLTVTPPGQTIKVSPGQHVRLDCRAYGHPAPSVHWSKHEPGYSFYEPKSVTPESPQGAVYEIRGATAADEGSYTCTGRNAAGEAEERVQLIVSDEQTTSGPSRGDIPSSGVYLPDDDFSIPLGGQVTIRCIAQGPQKIFLEWVRRDGQSLSPGAQVQDGVLYINKAQYSDAGDYSCQGVGSRGEVLFSAVAHLRVVEAMHIKLEPERQVVRPGDNARITCSATGEQPINISWQSENGQPLPQSVRVSGGIIEFIGIRESDAGRYVCKASNVRGILEATADVIVNGNHRDLSVRAVDRHPTAIEGQSIQLRCDTRENQQISWSREYQQLPSRATVQGAILRIDHLQPEDSGRYICRTNVYGSTAEDYIDLRVERVNDIELQIEPSSREVHYGDTVDLRCLAVGPANVNLYWSLADGSSLPANTRATGEVLRISTATSVNTGTYRCTAIFNNNRYDKDYILTVRDDRPTHDAASAETVTADYGQTVDLSCNIDLEGSITHSWNKHGGQLPANAQVSGPHMTISSVTYKDAGLYICTASNGNIQADIPKIILVRGAVPFFTQSPYSYLTLPTLANGYLNFNIEITFKPEQPDGLILYNGQQNGGTGDFISFGLHNAIPEFRFDVGSGPGIIRGTRPLALGQWHTVQLTRSKRQGTMLVDDYEQYLNSSTGRMQGLDLSLPLYLGGVPDFNNINKQNGFDSGFVGCISRLVINNKEDIDIMKEQKEAEGVTSCETCAVNPCVNSGVCQEAPTKQGYSCLCPRGFSGLNCSHTGEPCYPGACGSGRCVDSDEGIECYCALGQVGERCERDISVTEPSFNGNSYLAYPTPKALNKIKLALKFNPSDATNGLLLYCAENDDGTGDFIALAIRDRRLEFKFDAGTGLTTLRSQGEVVPGQWMTVNAGMGGREATLAVSGEPPITLPVRAEVFKFTTPLYVGGFDQQRIRPAAGVGARQGFRGCVAEVQASSLNLDLLRSVVDSANVAQCSSDLGDPCSLRPCINRGVCRPTPDGRSYQCDCPPGFSGQNCEAEQDMCAALQPCQNGGTCIGTPTSYKCNCPLGYAGPKCQDRTQFRTEVSFNGDGYVELSKELLPHTHPDESETIEVDFSTTEPNGLLLWHGQGPETDGRSQDYLSLQVVNGHLELSYELGSGPAVLVSKETVSDGRRHTAVIKRQGKDSSLAVDEPFPEFGESYGLLTQLNTQGNIYIGGLPNIEYMTGHTNITGFRGCIHSLQIQSSDTINFAERAISSVNTLPCTSSFSEADEDDGDEGPTRGDVGR